MKHIKEKIQQWVWESNHYKHLFFGSVYGVLFTLIAAMMCSNIWCAFWLTFVSGACLGVSWEANDKRHGSEFEVEDAGATLIGSTIGSLMIVVMYYLAVWAR